MKPAGYHVVPSSGGPMLILDHSNAVEKAVQRHGTVTALFSIAQVIEFLEEADDELHADAIDALSEFQA